jgi:hypothetical protein
VSAAQYSAPLIRARFTPLYAFALKTIQAGLLCVDAGKVIALLLSLFVIDVLDESLAGGHQWKAKNGEKECDTHRTILTV